MPLDITFLGHAGLLLSDGKLKLAIDPYLTDNPKAAMKADELKCDFIALTHGHEDHVGDTVAVAKANKATVFAAYEIAAFLGEQGVKNTEPGNPGGKITAPFGWIAFTQAFHSSSYQGRYMGMPCGVVVHMGQRTLYHCGDTCLFGDMKLIGEIYKPHVAAIPIGDRFTMGPELAMKAAELIRPQLAIPIHYNTWPPIEVDVKRFAPSGIEVKPLQPGETYRVA